MSGRIFRRTSIWLILGLAILSCGTPTLVTSSPIISEPGGVETVIVQTAEAAQVQTFEALPPTGTPTVIPLASKTPTVSPTPTATFLFLFPTKTDIPDAFFADDDDNGTGDSSDTDDKRIKRRQLWACRVLSKSPADETVIVGGTSFRAIWTVKNTGTETWPKKGVDLVYASGARLHDGKSTYDIPAAVGPEGTITFSITMTVPKRAKDYQTRWVLKVGRTEFCSVRFNVSVK